MKTAVITGGGKGMGMAIAVRFVQAGYAVALCARSENDLATVKALLLKQAPNAQVLTYPCDITVKEQVEAFAAFVLKAWPHIDVLVNNAGTYTPGSVYNEPAGSIEHMLGTNFYGAYNLTRALVPAMQTQRKGHIVNISSIAGIQPYNNGGSYSISKYAVTALGKNLREELKPFSIGVTNIYPGAVRTSSWNGTELPNERFIQPEDIAELVYTACSLSAGACIEDIVIRPMQGDL